MEHCKETLYKLKDLVVKELDYYANIEKVDDVNLKRLYKIIDILKDIKEIEGHKESGEYGDIAVSDYYANHYSMVDGNELEMVLLDIYKHGGEIKFKKAIKSLSNCIDYVKSNNKLKYDNLLKELNRL